MNGVSIPPLVPGSREWLSVMSASKVSTIFGLNNTYDSPYHLFQVMAGKIAAPAQTTAQSRGHYLEPAVAAWFKDQHPEYLMSDGDCWRHRDHEWYTAQPDRLLFKIRDGSTDADPLIPLECKSSASWSDEWGLTGSDDIPPRYRLQVMTQIDVLGAPYGYLAAILPGLEFREYRIDYDPDEAAVYRDTAKDFLDSIARDEPPPIDASPWTYRALKQLPRGVEDRSVEVGRDVADLLKAGSELSRDAARIRQEGANLVLAAIGSGRKAYYVDDDGVRVPVATRAIRKDGSTHSLRIAPSLTLEEAAA